MNLRYLETFCIVAEAGSLTAAAQRLGLTQSAVSLQLQKLEREFGAKLVDRGRQPVVLTAAGESLREQASQILSLYRTAQENVQRAAESVEGTLNVAASTIPGEYILPGLLSSFCDRCPAVRVVLDVSDTAGVYNRLTEGTAAFGFTGWRRDDLGLTFERFADDEIVLLGAAGADPGPHSAAALSSMKFLAREAGSGTLATVTEFMATALPGVTPPPSVMVLGSTEALLNAIRAGAGVGFVSARAAQCLEAAGQVVRLQVEGLRITRVLWMAYHPGRVTGALREAFLSFIREWRLEGGTTSHG